jgi:dynein heavy chain, axonemal
MIEENKRIRSKITQPFEQLILFRLNQLDIVILPGCTTFTWVSPNVDNYIEGVFKALDGLDLVLTRAVDLVAYRIEAVFAEMTMTSLCDLNEDEPVLVEDFLHRTEELCNTNGIELQSKSKNIEDAAQELIDLLYPIENLVEEEEEGADEVSEEIDEVKSIRGPDATSRHSNHRVPLTQAQIQRKKKKEQRIAMDENAKELLNFFSHKNLESIIKLIKSTLEKIRKRITATQAMNYINPNEKTKKEKPVFKCFAILAIPNISMQPALDDVQQSLNKAVQLIIGVSKHISLWNKERLSSSKKKLKAKQISDEINNQLGGTEDFFLSSKGFEADRPASPSANKNYFKSVSDNKDIAKISSLLSTCINSTKKDVVSALDRFKGYQYIWQKDRDEDLKEFLQQETRVSEFEAKIRTFEKLIEEINTYPEFIPIGPIALATERLKLGLITEIGIWKQHYGSACNQLYKKELNFVLEFLDDIDKRLQRPIKDLDDIRIAMAALKEIRENEIKIDMTILPVEESYSMLVKHEIIVNREEVEKCDTLRYSWQKLLQLASSTSSSLLDIQPKFRDELVFNIKEFVIECNNFFGDYNKVSRLKRKFTRYFLKLINIS